MRQLTQTGRLRQWNASSNRGLYFTTQRWTVAWSSATLLHQFFDMPIAQRVGSIPAHAHENDIRWEMDPLATDRHRRSPALRTVGHRERP
jgi:hypothetical protein